MPKQIPDIPHGPAALGAYSVATEANGFVFISGQVAIDPATNTKVDGDVAAQTRQILTNYDAILGDLGLTKSDIVKTTIFLADIDDFAGVNQIYGDYFSGANPARSTIQAGALPGGFQVEIEAIAAR